MHFVAYSVVDAVCMVFHKKGALFLSFIIQSNDEQFT